jgi:hypothetical protein
MNAAISSETQLKKLAMAEPSIDLGDCIVVNTTSILAKKPRHSD